MIRVRFLETVIYETEGRNQGPEYVAHEEYDLRDDLAERWLQRGLAVRADADAPPAGARRGRGRRGRGTDADDLVVEGADTVTAAEGDDTLAGGDAPD